MRTAQILSQKQAKTSPCMHSLSARKRFYQIFEKIKHKINERFGSLLGNLFGCLYLFIFYWSPSKLRHLTTWSSRKATVQSPEPPTSAAGQQRKKKKKKSSRRAVRKWKGISGPSDKVVKRRVSGEICHSGTRITDRQIYSKRSHCAPSCACVCVRAILRNGPLKIPLGRLLPLVTDSRCTSRVLFFVCVCVFCFLCRLLPAVTYCKAVCWAALA